MNSFDFSSPSFIDRIKKGKAIIYKNTNNPYLENIKFIQLHRNLLTFLNNTKRENILVLGIKKENIEKLDSDYYNRLDDLLHSSDAIYNNCIYVDSDLKIVEASKEASFDDSNEASDVYKETSKDFVIFLLLPSENAIKCFVDGASFGESPFSTSKDLVAYERLKTVGEIEQLFDEYRNSYLKKQVIYSKFFVTKAHRRLIKSEDESVTSQLLNNKPENLFREDLLFFLNKNMRAEFFREPILDDKKRLDIHFLDESGTERYLIEIKWVGTSVHGSGDKIGISIGEGDINPNAIFQTVQYLKQLHDEDKRKVIKLGYLVVFDAREGNHPDTVVKFNEKNNLSADLLPHYKKFRKIPDFKVVNIHPS